MGSGQQCCTVLPFDCGQVLLLEGLAMVSGRAFPEWRFVAVIRSTQIRNGRAAFNPGCFTIIPTVLDPLSCIGQYSFPGKYRLAD